MVSALATMLLANPGRASVPLTRADLETILNRVELVQRGRVRPARTTDFMSVGDSLRTAAASRAELRFNDGSLARVGERATFQFVPNTRNFRLTDGTLLLLIPPNRGRSVIETPSAVTGIQGSAVVVRHVQESNLTVVMALTNNPDGPMTMTINDCAEGGAVNNNNCATEYSLYAGQMALVQNARVQVLDFDLHTFYNTSPLVDGLELDNPHPKTPLGGGLEEVRGETLAALNQHSPFNDANVTLLNPARLSVASDTTTARAPWLITSEVAGNVSSSIRTNALTPLPAGAIPTSPSTDVASTSGSGTNSDSPTNRPTPSVTSGLPKNPPGTSTPTATPTPPTTEVPTTPAVPANPATPELPATPANPTTPGVPATPAVPANPTTPGLPTTPAVPATPATPQLPTTPANPATPEVPATPAVPANPTTPGLPTTPAVPATPATPQLPTTPANPATPEVPATPAVPATPTTPGLPATPAVPATPATPQLPTTPANPATPGVPATPAVPATPTTPGVPATPAVPANPATPAIPELPATPTVPTTPELPVTPELPTTPELPITPELPEIPFEPPIKDQPGDVVDVPAEPPPFTDGSTGNANPTPPAEPPVDFGGADSTQ
jgi:hypothetical protein